MRTGIRNRMITFLSLILSVCMLIGAAFAIVKTTAKAENTTAIATQVEGASVRVTDANASGIRFRARLNRADYNALYANYGGENGYVNAGMIIVPTDYITKAGGYSFSAFGADLKVAKKNTEGFAAVTVDGTDYLEYALSLVNIKDANYAREFEAIAYIEIAAAGVTDSAPEGFEKVGDYYYAYAKRNADYARTIYEVANATYNDRKSAEDASHPYNVNGKWMSVDEDGLAIVKGYVDGVADVKITNNVPTIANNTTYYTSPYKLATNSKTGDYILSGEPKSLIVDGERQTDMHVEKGMVEIHTSRGFEATVNGDELTLTYHKLSSSGQPFTLIPDAYTSNGSFTGLANSYYAFDGKYGVGTAIDIYFTGANIPQILLFADKIDGNMTGYSSYKNSTATANNSKGYLIYTGMKSANNNAETFSVWGPDRIYTESMSWGSGFNSSAQNYALTYGTSAGQAKYFTQQYLASNYSDTEFKWTVSTYKNASGNLEIKIEIFKKIDGQYVTFDTTSDGTAVFREKTVDTKVSVDDVIPGSIVLFGGGDCDETDTVFTCSAPYSVGNVSGGTVEADGTVTLNAVGASSNTAPSGIIGLSIPYVAFEGNYGIGTFVDFEFTGNNMPQVMFFANNIDGNITSRNAGGTIDTTAYRGLYITNGMLTTQHNTDYSSLYYQRSDGGYMLGGQYLAFYGPGRIHNNLLTIGYSTNVISQDSLFTYKGLEGDTTERTYIYKVGTLLDETDNTIIIHAELTDKETGALITTATKDTGISNTELSGGNVIAYGQIKGDGNTTTFKASKPYAGKANYQMSGATIDADGTVTLAARTGGGIRGSGQLFGLIEGSADYTAGGPVSYLGLAGEYGVGTYMDFYFTGNNMPEVMFFADVINERMTGYTGYASQKATSTGEKGVLISNGLYDATNNFENAFTVWGPNRIYFGDDVEVTGTMNSHISSAAYSLTDGSLLTQATLAKDEYSGTQFKYTVGTYKAGKNLGVHVILYTVGETTLTKVVETTIDTGIALTEISAGNIICYQTIKSDDTVFKYTAPYESKPAYFISKGSIDSTGTVTLTGANGGNRINNIWQIDSAYYALTGEYGVGTKVDVYFTGNNMPEVLFFANNINGNMTGFESMETVPPYTNNVKGDNYGLLFSNGFTVGNDGNGADWAYTVWGMDRIYITSGYESGFGWQTGYLYRSGAGKSDYSALSQTALASEENADVNFKYTVGTYENDEGYMVVSAVLINAATAEEIGSIEYTTNILAKDVKPGSIIFYDTVKGANNDTVFKISEPYK